MAFHTRTVFGQSPVSIDGEALGEVDQYTYLGSIFSKEDGARPDLTSRLNKAKAAFARLRPVSEDLKSTASGSTSTCIIVWLNPCYFMDPRVGEWPRRIDKNKNTLRTKRKINKTHSEPKGR
jgi:hypothetical protein